jgi:general secretion pathway protein L
MQGQGGANWTRRLAEIDWRAWRLPAALAAGSVAAFLFGLNLHWAKLSAERDDLHNAMRATLKSSFSIEDVPGGDRAKYMGSKLRALRSTAGQTGPDDFVPLIARFSRALGPQSNNLLTGLEYRDGFLKVTFRPAAVKATSARRKMEQACKRLGLNLVFDSGQSPTSARVQVL